MRLNAYLARAGVASRRGADELIKAGRVTVNGEPGQLNTFVQSRDRVELDGERVELQPLDLRAAAQAGRRRDDRARPAGPAHRRRARRPSATRVVPVGRLDADTTGALLLTNDGELAHRLAHPRYEVEKVYEAEVEGDPGDEALEQLARRHRARRRPDRARRRPAGSAPAQSSSASTKAASTRSSGCSRRSGTRSRACTAAATRG